MGGDRRGNDRVSERMSAVSHRGTRLSVVLATYNGERFLDEQLHTLTTQSRLPDELVVVDDASQDRTVEIVELFARRAPFPVHIVRNAEHEGTCRTFEKGFDRSTGEILVICDQDDRWLPEKLAVIGDEMARHPEALLAFSDATLIDASGEPLSRSRWRIAGFGPRQWSAMRRDPFGQMLMRQVVSGCTAAIRRELLEALLPFPTDLHPALPTMMYDRWISPLAAATGRLHLIPERLVEYRIHPGQQIGIPALPLRRVLPQTALRVGQFVAPQVEKAGRFGYQLAHLHVIEKRLDNSNLDSGTARHVLHLAAQHLELRERVNSTEPRNVRKVVRDVLGPDGYRRFSFGVAAALSDLTR